ncbi:AEX-3 domain-containing protein [Melampsora americana]|nr:AEX-3 domain-containing protein [Melampsora americana]
MEELQVFPTFHPQPPPSSSTPHHHHPHPHPHHQHSFSIQSSDSITDPLHSPQLNSIPNRLNFSFSNHHHESNVFPSIVDCSRLEEYDDDDDDMNSDELNTIEGAVKITLLNQTQHSNTSFKPSLDPSSLTHPNHPQDPLSIKSKPDRLSNSTKSNQPQSVKLEDLRLKKVKPYKNRKSKHQDQDKSLTSKPMRMMMNSRRMSRSNSSIEMNDENEDFELDGFVDVPPSFTLPKFTTQYQNGGSVRKPRNSSLNFRRQMNGILSSNSESFKSDRKIPIVSPISHTRSNRRRSSSMNEGSLNSSGLGIALTTNDSIDLNQLARRSDQLSTTSTFSNTRSTIRPNPAPHSINRRNSAAPPSRRVSAINSDLGTSSFASDSEATTTRPNTTILDALSDLPLSPSNLNPSKNQIKSRPQLNSTSTSRTLQSNPRPTLNSTSTRTTDSNADIYASADTSFSHLPDSPPLPPMPDFVKVNDIHHHSFSTTSARPHHHPLRPSRSNSQSRLRKLKVQTSRTTLDTMFSSVVSPTGGIHTTDTMISEGCSTTQPHNSETRTLASLYMVCGLPKDPQCWTLAQPDHLPAHLDSAVPRFWRPEVLGTTLAGQDADLLSSELDKRKPSRSSRHANGHQDHPAQSTSQRKASSSIPKVSTQNQLGKEELARVQAKAMKLAFAREVEVIASTVQPPSTTHCFSFTVPVQNEAITDATGAIGQQWDLGLAAANLSNHHQLNTSNRPKTYYGACLQVWSHADRSRSEAIRRAVEEGSKAKSAAIARAVKAAAAGKRFGARLQRATNSAMGVLPTPDGLAGKNWSVYNSGAETDTDTEGFVSESEWDGPASMLPIANLPGGTPFWLPYCLILISKMPIYDLMTDHLRISWARYHQAIGKHSQQMLKMLNFPCPKPGETVRMPVGGTQQSSSSTYFVAKIPGKTDLSNGGLEDVDFTMWPVFKSLSLSNLVSIYELALSPMGRVVFFSRYPAMLNMAVETFRVLLELRGWQGLCQSIVHARDVKIYLEDPGPYLLGMNSQLRPITANAPQEVMIVDLDTNNITCPKPHPQAYSKGQTRIKIERKLEEVIGTLGGVRGVPPEFHEAFPGGRFRPFSAVEIKDSPSEAERLLPPAEWNWDQTKAVMAFDSILSKVPRKGLARVFRKQAYRHAAQLDASAQHVQEIVRKHTTGFVDRRDMLESKIWKLNRRLAFLMAESMEWKQHFDLFQRFADKLSVESQDLKTRLEVERRDHHKLSGVVNEQKFKQAQLEARLLETEQAWMAAQVELAKAQAIREGLEREKQIMVTEMKSIALGDDDQTILATVVPKVENSYNPSRNSMLPNDSASLTSKNLRRFSAQAFSPHSQPRASPQLHPPTSSLRGHSPQPVDDLDSPDLLEHLSMQSPSQYNISSPSGHDRLRSVDEMSEFDTSSEAESGISTMDERALLSRTAVIETMRSIQGRLEAALRTAGQLDEDELKSYEAGGLDGIGNPRKSYSRKSAESQDSKVIPLSRARRKPTINENDESSPDSTRDSLLDCVSLSRPDSVPLSRPTTANNRISVSSNGTTSHQYHSITLLKQRNNPRTSAVSLLRPGSSIFDRDRNTNTPTDITTPDHTKLETVIDGNESEGIQEISHGSSERLEEKEKDEMVRSPSPTISQFQSPNQSDWIVDEKRFDDEFIQFN